MDKGALDSFRGGSNFSLKNSKYRVNESGERRLVGKTALHGFDTK